MVTAAAVALGVLELKDETSAEIDGQLFIVVSALTDGESFDVVTSAGGDRCFESWRKLHKRLGPYEAGRARYLLRYLVTTASEGNPHTLADDIRTSSLEALLPEDHQKHVQLNRS